MVKKLWNIILLCILSLPAWSQKTVVTDSSQPGFRTIIAGPQYQKSKFHQFFWGRHYRKEWSTAVTVPVIDLEKEKGGLTPLEQGGGRQTKNLRLVDRNGKQYVLRMVDKNYKGAIPPIMHGTFIEKILNDQISSGHPFAAVTVREMISKTGIYHTQPRIVYVPYSARLGKFNEVFGGTLCLLEERPDEDQSDAPNFGFSKNVIGSPKLMEKLRENPRYQVDQGAYVKARLFDIFIGDWGRHEDQWRWASFDSAGWRLYRPVPRDRDQTYTLFDGLLTNIGSSLANVDHLQSFDHTIDDIETYNFPARNLDRRMANAMPKEIWLQKAQELQQQLTDSIIERGVRQMPPELFAISGQQIIDKLKRRRNDLQQYAGKYYHFISRRVDIVGTEQAELFRVSRLNANEVKVEIFPLHENGQPSLVPSYARLFHEEDTKEIRLYGLNGKDQYVVEGEGRSIRVNIIGGTEKDNVQNLSHAGRVHYYDNPGNAAERKVRKHVSTDTSINRYDYDAFKYNSGGMVILPWYSNRRGIFFNLGYKFKKQQWRKEPYGWKQKLTGYYSITNRSFGADYEGHFVQLLGKWDLLLNGSYDERLDNYFLGVGNETAFNGEKDYYKLYTQEANFTVDLTRPIGKKHYIGWRAAYDMVRVKKEDGKTLFNDQVNGTIPHVFNKQHFAGTGLFYEFISLNNEVLPTRGMRFTASAHHIQNIHNHSKNFQRYSGMAVFYLPFGNRISLASRTGFSHIEGRPEFYQLNTLGGGQTLRGYFRQRFYGSTSYFNNNDLRFLFPVRGKLFNGQMGPLVFADNGRVWNEGESSSKLHWGYGGGLMMVPFNKIAITVYFGKGEDLSKFHFRVGRFF